MANVANMLTYAVAIPTDHRKSQYHTWHFKSWWALGEMDRMQWRWTPKTPSRANTSHSTMPRVISQLLLQSYPSSSYGPTRVLNKKMCPATDHHLRNRRPL
ncbi:hypothetical protein MN608_07772 [Microdochium nivale]|nr:hypothetical protein MN608_07772 [Microdochium nivale]